MTPENPNEGNQTTAGATQPPVAPSSPVAGQLSPDEIKALRELPTLVKGLQKGTDKQIGQVRADIKRILELKESGMNEQQIQRELALDAILEQGNAAKPLVGNEGQQAQSLDTVDKSKVLAELELDANDPVVLPLLSLNGDKFEAAATKVALQRAKQPKPSPASASALQGHQAPPADGAKLIGEYQSKMIAARGKPTELRAIKAEYEKKGVPVDQVAFI